MSDESSLLDWLSIRLAPEMNRARFYNLMERFVTPAGVFGARASEIAHLRGFDNDLAATVLRNRNVDAVRRHADRLQREHIHIVTRNDAEYPENLAHSSLAPPLLFVKGRLIAEDKYSIAMVGSRHATQYGRGVARELSAGLARYGMTVVSGFARGVDGEAHHAALKAGGRTIAVLGNGMDVCYPSEHHSLVARVAENGALISEYPLGTAPERFNFPERNHVIAALTLGTIVVEAAEKSGSLITARLAVEENRFIFAVPGDITRNNSRGANSLIMQGARMVQRPQDVLIEMKDVLRGYLDSEALEETEEPAAKPPPRPARRKMSSDSSESDMIDLQTIAGNVQSDDRLTENPLMAKSPAKTTRVPTAAAAPKLTEEEDFIVGLLRHEALVFDQLAEHAFLRGMDVPRLSSILVKLELRQVIRQLPGRYYVLFA